MVALLAAPRWEEKWLESLPSYLMSRLIGLVSPPFGGEKFSQTARLCIPFFAKDAKMFGVVPCFFWPPPVIQEEANFVFRP